MDIWIVVLFTDWHFVGPPAPAEDEHSVFLSRRGIQQQLSSYRETVIRQASVAASSTVHRDDAPTCGICHKTKFADGCGHLCSYCQTKFCARCGGRVSLRSNTVRALVLWPWTFGFLPSSSTGALMEQGFFFFNLSKMFHQQTSGIIFILIQVLSGIRFQPFSGDSLRFLLVIHVPTSKSQR